MRLIFFLFQALQDSKTSYLANTENASMADVLLIVGLLIYLEQDKDILNGFPVLKVSSVMS